jgi:hypothetical protein
VAPTAKTGYLELRSVLPTLMLVLVCGWLAWRLLNWLWPIVMRRHEMTAAEMIEHAVSAPVREQQRQATLYGSRRRTLCVHALNMVLLGLTAASLSYSAFLFFGLLSYLAVGFGAAAHAAGAPKAAELVGLTFRERTWLRMFHAWQWPLYVTYLLVSHRR